MHITAGRQTHMRTGRRGTKSHCYTYTTTLYANTDHAVQVSYTVTKISDSHGYMEALGATQTALVMREAAEGRAKNEAESTKNTSLSQVSCSLCKV
jgi:hypothetical protein